MAGRRVPWAWTFAALLLAGCLSPSEAPQEAAHHAHDAPHQHGESMPHASVLDPLEWDPSTPPNLSHAPPFALEDGQIPTRTQALDFANQYSRFIARGNEGLEKLRAEGHLQGEGTPDQPYVLKDFYIQGELSITSTNRSLIVRNGYVEGQFKLNYAGESVYVHHVYARDLRVNENVERHGPNTGGLFHGNAFAFVGQIRHFVGEFRDNTIGPRPANVVAQALGDSGLVAVPDPIVFNFDGFHGTDVHHNTFIGRVDVKLHGHNHGDCFTCPVHDHSDESTFPGASNDSHEGHAHASDPVAHELGLRSHHSVRYASLSFHHNEIRVNDGWALRYNDRNHAGDDRTANSEPNPYLEDAHVHFQDVTIERNRLVGGGLLVDIFNAEDERHPVLNRGILRVLTNDVAVSYADPGWVSTSGRPSPGIEATQASGIEFLIEGNKVRFQKTEGGLVPDPTRTDATLTGLQLADFDAGNVTIRGNVVEQGTYGVFARRLSESLQWRLVDNEFRTRHNWRGEDIANAPKEE